MTSLKSSLLEVRPLTISLLLLLSWVLLTPAAAQEEDPTAKARSVIDRAIEAMGGETYMSVESSASSGRYFRFNKGRKAFAKYWDWTVYDPVKWRFQLGEGGRRFVQIYDLEKGEGWILEGETSVEPASEENIENFREAVREDLDVLLRSRVDEEGMNIYYYSADEIAGAGEYEAVEFLDSTNQSIVVFFDRESHLPAKTETQYTDSAGVRHTRETEFYNWHEIQGVNVALRYDTYVDDEMSSQRFVEEIEFNPSIPPEYFQKPVPKD